MCMCTHASLCEKAAKFDSRPKCALSPSIGTLGAYRRYKTPSSQRSVADSAANSVPCHGDASTQAFLPKRAQLYRTQTPIRNKADPGPTAHRGGPTDSQRRRPAPQNQTPRRLASPSAGASVVRGPARPTTAAERARRLRPSCVIAPPDEPRGPASPCAPPRACPRPRRNTPGRWPGVRLGRRSANRPT